jgi:hypothetical protein
VRNQSDLDAAFATLKALKIDAFLTGTDALLNSSSNQLAVLAARHSIPGISQNREFVDAGGLISYGASRSDTYRQIGVYTGRIPLASYGEVFDGGAIAQKGDGPCRKLCLRPTPFQPNKKLTRN